ncbi:hypothetical protein BV25DRAFT_325220 [Artomyces pyxidatus]|uniref:Uncharacterized protein n=1 Tax=Artomyces pyxidatus TaxID=48021 RepID=A0ACB8T541_9AGAM|nr:hypothetical protein BV25DRAFT_325220 [Artomyces pyxidatus]
MSFRPFPNRSHASASTSSGSFRPPPPPTPPASAVPASYSSLNEALGNRPPHPLYSPQFSPETSPTLMSSDGRYMYQPPPQGSASYEYQSYPPPPSYDPQQYPPNPSQRPARAPPSQSHSPSEPVSYNSSSSSYPPFTSGSYPVPQPPPQWNNDSWSHYGQPGVNPPPSQEAATMSGPGRPDAAPAPSGQRGHAPSLPSLEPHRSIETVPQKAQEAHPASKRKTRDKDAAFRHQTPPVSSSALDFAKLIESYRVIIETTSALSNDPATGQGRPPPADILQRMAESANYGSQLLSAMSGSVPPSAFEEQTPAAPGGEEGEGASKRQKSEGPVTEGQTCLGCNATSTPEWRRGPLGPRTLCNACGLVYAKLIKKRKREAIRRANQEKGVGGGPPDDLGPSSGEEDEDSYSGIPE